MNAVTPIGRPIMPAAPETVETCDVCIVGAGFAGMNALFVASEYLSRGQRVILVDRRARVGGMWVDTYDYVRLHQPHPMFTAGNIKWTIGKPPSHLATKSEVLEHFSHCLNVIKHRVRVDEYFGYTLQSDIDNGDSIRVTCTSSDGTPLTIDTKRLVKAFGFQVEPNDPLPVSSSRVRSVSPDSCDMRSGDIAASDDPVWIIGGGKTAMDTAHTLITDNPGRSVNLLGGSGTFFHTREKFFPTGHRRWWGGTSLINFGLDTCNRFDGTNEDSTWEWHRAKYANAVTPVTGSFALGVLSAAESRTINAGLDEVVMGHLVDIEDRDGTPELRLRTGETKSIQPDSWVVNCTGYMDVREYLYEPFASAGGNKLSIGMRSMALHLSSYVGYYMTHLMFMDKLLELPLYELDGHALRAKSHKAFPYGLLMLAQYNMGLIAEAVPNRVLLDCGLDFERWYPPHRRAISLARLTLTQRRQRPLQRRALDTLRERFDVRCGPLPKSERTEPAVAS